MKLNQRFAKLAYTERKREDGIREFVPAEPQMFRRNLAADVESSDGLFTLSFSSESPVMVWGEHEVLSHEAGDANLQRLAEVGAILKNHDPAQIVGVPTGVTLDATQRKGRLTARWGTTDLAKQAQHEAEVDKTLRGVSVGYIVKRWLWLEKDQAYAGGRIQGPAWVAVEWEALEASLTPIPADPSVGLNRTIEQSTAGKYARKHSGDNNLMKNKVKLLRSWAGPDGTEFARNDIVEVDAETYAELTTGENPAGEAYTGSRTAKKVEAAPLAPVIDLAKARDEAAKAERSRVSEINSLCRRHGLEDSVAETLIEKGVAIEEARKTILDKLAENAKPIDQSITITKDGAETFRAAAIDGVLLRSGVAKVDKPASGASAFRGTSLLRLAEECLRRSGVRDIPGDTRAMVNLALGMRGAETIAGSTSDFPIILSNIANKSLLAGYDTAPTSFQFWAAISSLNDFKSTQRIKFSDVGKLKFVPENGKYSETALSESKEVIQLGTFGRIWTMSRQAIINDDLDAFTRVPASFGMQARYLPNDLAIAVLTANAAMSDGNALFSETHTNNSQETDRRLDTVAHAQAAAVYMYNLMAQQQTMAHANETDGKRYLNLRPRVWLVSMTDEIIARQAIVSAGDASATNKDIINPIAGLSLQVIADQNIKTSEADYSHYMFADPRIAPVVEVAFLQGNQQPYFERLDQTDSDGSKWLIRLDCGAAAVDHVGAVRETGTDA
jgi:hypothetical protein